MMSTVYHIFIRYVSTHNTRLLYTYYICTDGLSYLMCNETCKAYGVLMYLNALRPDYTFISTEVQFVFDRIAIQIIFVFKKYSTIISIIIFVIIIVYSFRKNINTITLYSFVFILDISKLVFNISKIFEPIHKLFKQYF